MAAAIALDSKTMDMKSLFVWQNECVSSNIPSVD